MNLLLSRKIIVLYLTIIPFSKKEPPSKKKRLWEVADHDHDLKQGQQEKQANFEPVGPDSEEDYDISDHLKQLGQVADQKDHLRMDLWRFQEEEEVVGLEYSQTEAVQWEEQHDSGKSDAAQGYPDYDCFGRSVLRWHGHVAGCSEVFRPYINQVNLIIRTILNQRI